VPDDQRDLPDGVHLQSTVDLWPDERRGPWRIELHWQILGGRAECIGIDLRSAVPTPERPEDRISLPPPRKLGEPVTATLLRQLRIGQLVESYRADMYEITRGDQLYRSRGTRRPRTDLSRLAEVAEVYREAHRQGRPTGRAVADRFTVSVSNARKMIYEARREGELPPTAPGVAVARKRKPRSPRPARPITKGQTE
jgi:hypothetical protein